MESDNKDDLFISDEIVDDVLHHYEDTSTDFWNILIADDAEEIHFSTKFALRNVIICGKPLNLIDSYSADQTKQMIIDRDDIHIVLLDAVMEHDKAGIDCAKFIREDLRRKLPIIVMRTGFAGWEVESDPHNLDFIDDFILKSNTSRTMLIDILEKWLLHVSQL